MKNTVFYCFFVWLLCVSMHTYAQEFNTTITINTPRLQTADPKVFKNLENAIKEFMNTRKWTEQELEPEEYIDLSIVLTVTEELSPTDFKGEIIIQASRPVYMSSYNSVLFQYLDKDFQFRYGEFEVLDFTEGVFNSDLTSVLAFYAYVILGLEQDSYAEASGNTYFDKAQDIVNAASTSKNSGWKRGASAVKRNRYWLIENLLSARLQKMRTAFYQYHLLGLDRLSQEDKREEGLVSIVQAIAGLKEANRSYPGSMWVQLFIDAKRKEIIEVFKITDMMTRRNLYNSLMQVDGTHAADYKVLLKP